MAEDSNVNSSFPRPPTSPHAERALPTAFKDHRQRRGQDRRHDREAPQAAERSSAKSCGAGSRPMWISRGRCSPCNTSSTRRSRTLRLARATSSTPCSTISGRSTWLYTRAIRSTGSRRSKQSSFGGKAMSRYGLKSAGRQIEGDVPMHVEVRLFANSSFEAKKMNMAWTVTPLPRERPAAQYHRAGRAAWGWRVYHVAKVKGHLRARTSPGFPDLVMVRAPRLLFAELKAHWQVPEPRTRRNGRLRLRCVDKPEVYGPMEARRLGCDCRRHCNGERYDLSQHRRRGCGTWSKTLLTDA